MIKTLRITSAAKNSFVLYVVAILSGYSWANLVSVGRERLRFEDRRPLRVGRSE